MKFFMPQPQTQTEDPPASHTNIGLPDNGQFFKQILSTFAVQAVEIPQGL